MARPRSPSRSGHPVIRRYVRTDHSLVEILRSEEAGDDPVIRALLLIQECLARKRMAKDAIQAAQAVVMDDAEPNLLLMMLSSWAELSCRIGRPTEAEALIHRAHALITRHTYPEIEAVAILVESILEDAKGNKQRREERLKAIVDLLPHRSPRLKFYRWELAFFLAQQGRGTENEASLRQLEKQTGPHFESNRLLAVQFVDAVETGRLDEAAQLEARLDAEGDVLTRSHGALSAYAALLHTLRGAPARKGGQPNERRPSGTSLGIEIVRCLLGGQTDQALRFARHEAGRLLGSFLGSGFDSFNLIRAELSAGHADAARRLIRIRHARGNAHYLDSFFLARAARITRNGEAAARHFADAINAVDQYRASGRMDIELRLAAELHSGDVLALTREAERLVQPAESGRAPVETAAGEPPEAIETIIGRSPAIAETRQAILRIADADAPVLITGETGTGKELVARALHENSSRREAPFLAVNCGAIAESLLDSELFGHRRGAFTGADRANKGLFEEAGDGTLLLDEMGAIHTRLQAALLRVLETGEIRAVGSSTTRRIGCRILAATNADLHRLSEEGAFRPDLLFRLQRLGVHLPPLRERREDILLLAQHFLDSGRPAGVTATMDAALRRTLESYDWPGNVRELKNVIERMRLMHSDKLAYSLNDLDLKFRTTADRNISRIPLPESMLQPSAPNRTADPSRTTGRPLNPSARPAAADPDRAGPPGPDGTIETILRGGKSQLRRLDRLRTLFRQHGKLTRREIVDILEVSPNTATKDLKTLVREGLIERVTPSASTRSHYFQLRAADTP